MKLTWKHALYLLVAFAVIGLVAVIWILFGKMFAGILGLLGLGGSGLLKQYVNTETRAAKDHGQVDTIHKSETSEINAGSLRQDKQLQAQDLHEATTTNEAINRATTRAQLAEIIRRERDKTNSALDDVEKLLPPIDEPGEGGFVCIGVVMLLLVVSLLLLVLASGSAHANGIATESDKVTAQKITDTFRRCRTLSQRLANQLMKERRQHAADLKACRAHHKVDNTKHTQQKAILIQHPIPPVWPKVVAGVVVAAIVAGAIGVGVGYYMGAKRP